MATWEVTNFFQPLTQGFFIYISLISALGPQNMFILQQGVRRRHLFTMASLSTFADFILIGVAVGGMGATITASPVVLSLATSAGALFLGGYAIYSFCSIWRGPASLEDRTTARNSMCIKQTVMATLSFALLNPSAYLDTLLLVGANSSRYALDERWAFGVGAILASAIWFFSLSYGASRLAPLLRHARAWRILELFSGCIMLGLALALWYQ